MGEVEVGGRMVWVEGRRVEGCGKVMEVAWRWRRVDAGEP